ncbi:ATP-binding protein [Mycolicibacterium brisbanense]
MTAFSQLKQADGTVVEFASTPHVPAKRPSRWSPANWPVRGKVLAIVLVPLILAIVFGGLRIYGSSVEASRLRLAADRAEMIPDIDKYMAALESVMVAATEGGDTQAATAEFTARKNDLRQRTDSTQVANDVAQSVNSLIDKGQELVGAVTANAVDLRTRVMGYGSLLLTAETAITGSARTDDQDVQLKADALSRAIGARGQMMMQRLLVTRGGDLPEPVLRSSMVALAGTEPSTVTAMAKVLGGASERAATLRSEMVKRLGMLSDPTIPLVDNPDLLASLQATDKVAEQMIGDFTESIPAAVDAEANHQRSTAIRDAILVAIAIVSALVIVLLVARSLVRPLRTLRDSALRVAHEDLATEIERVRSGGEPGIVEPLPVYTTEEVGQVAHAVDELHQQAVFLAGEQAQLQSQVSDMFETLSRRSRSLVDQQLSLIDRLERDEDDPERLESLFKLDHLAARMRRNGANLLVLSGSKVTREHKDPVPIDTIINAAASEVEDYARVITATVAEAEVVGSASGDLIHLLAELLDNALRYSPPISQVRVSAVYADTGGLVIEVSDIGLGMTEADLRVANARLQSGGEVNPYTARHMGLFVVGRLATQHGLVVRLRSTIADEPNSGTTAGIYIPAELLVRDGVSLAPAPRPTVNTSGDAPMGLAAAMGLDTRPGGSAADAAEPMRNGSADAPFGLLPQRNPGASGISDLPPTLAPITAEPSEPAAEEPAAEPAAEALPTREPATSWPQQWPTDEDEHPSRDTANGALTNTAVTNTSAFFASRAQAASNGAQAEFTPPAPAPLAAPQPAADEPHPVTTAGDGDAIYQSMVTEWDIDPTTHVRSADLDWKTVWEKGWTVAAAAQDAPVEQHTEEGLPMRTPGARLVPGGVAAVAGLNGRHRNGGAHRYEDSAQAVASADEPDSGVFAAFQPRDPEAVRASISNHFGGVAAGRSHARETRGTDSE